jgi:penicillin amidase
MEEDAAGAVGFGFVWKQMVEEVFGDEFPEQAWPPAGLGTFQTAVYYLLSEPQNPVWDDKASIGVVEDRDDILGRSLVRGLLAAREEQGDRPERWKWGEVHQIEFRNSTLGESGIGLIESIFNRGPFPLAGSSATVNVAHWSINDPFRVRSIASQRAIYDPANPSNSLFIHPTGQSGHPFHQHYDDFIRPWREARYHPARWTREEVEASAGGRRLVLVPDDADSSAAVQEASGKM